MNNPDIEFNDELLEKMLSRFTKGASCDDPYKDEVNFQIKRKNIIQAVDGDIIDALKSSGTIRFIGEYLSGGILDSKDSVFYNDKRSVKYKILENNILEVSAVCENQTFTIKNFNKEQMDFNIKLASKPYKELAIVLNVATSMSNYIYTLKEVAPFIAKHIYKDDDKELFSKIVMVTFSSLDSDEWGSFYCAQDFIEAINNIKMKDSNTRMLNLSIIKAMSSFTKDNGLKKEIILISNGRPSDMQNTDRMLSLTKNLNQNIAYNSKGCLDNCVTIHSIALSPNLTFLKEIAEATNGHFYEANDMLSFKKSILTISNDGLPFDIRELDNVIRPSKTHKIYDPDNPS